MKLTKRKKNLIQNMCETYKCVLLVMCRLINPFSGVKQHNINGQNLIRNKKNI